MNNQNEHDSEEFPPFIKAFLDHLSPPPGKGNNIFLINWTLLTLFIPFIFYLFSFFDNQISNWCLFAYSFLLLIFFMVSLQATKIMQFGFDSFSFVKIQVILFFLIIVNYGFSYYFLFKLNTINFHSDANDLNILDMIYYSFVTITTLGYGEIYPKSSLGKIIVISELSVGIWFLSTILPIAIADQSERIRHFRITKKKMMEEFDQEVKNGTMKMVGSYIKTKDGSFVEEDINEENK